MVTIRKRENESNSSTIYRFIKRVQQSGVLIEARKRRFSHRNIGRNKRRVSAMYRDIKQKEFLRLRKLGVS